MIVHGFNLDDALVCEGIIGDGCGGGRIFAIKDDLLFAYDPLTKEKNILLSKIKGALKISKRACIITIECEDKILHFNLSLLALI